MILKVCNEYQLIGQLFTSELGVQFVYDPAYAAADAMPISASLPLQEEAFGESRALPFFEGLLPEGDQRKQLSDLLHVSSSSTVKLLAALAGECVGNLIILDEDNTLEQAHFNDGYQALNETELQALIKPQSIECVHFIANRRLSLAGAQSKLGLYQADGQWFATCGLAPTTHILKPASLFDASLLANEVFMMRLAGACNISVPNTEIIRSGEYSALSVQRFDRIRTTTGDVVRLMQEDYCQALSVMPLSKYENDGGPSLKDCFYLTRQHASMPLANMQALLRLILFNYLIGNCDAHGKNLSFLHDPTKFSSSFAPAYDLLSTTFYGDRLQDSMAMKIGSHSKINHIDNEDFSQFAQQTGITMSAVTTEINDLRKMLSMAIANVADGLLDESPQFASEIKSLQQHILTELELRSHVLSA